VGCGACGRTGYHGRFALHECLLINEDIERMIAEQAHSEDIRKIAIGDGMYTLKQAGLSQVCNGVTTVDEVLRVVA
jgi:type IV pilus assembly protein PilB